jgi:hypothetical protein
MKQWVDRRKKKEKTCVCVCCIIVVCETRHLTIKIKTLGRIEEEEVYNSRSRDCSTAYIPAGSAPSGPFPHIKAVKKEEKHITHTHNTPHCIRFREKKKKKKKSRERGMDNNSPLWNFFFSRLRMKMEGGPGVEQHSTERGRRKNPAGVVSCWLPT